jgi:DNA-directed RNA polymerase specialized sigma24 family protein
MQDNKLIKALVLNAQLGNNSAFEQLYQLSVGKVFILLLRLAGNSKSASELTKKTYVNGWQQISEKSENESFLQWIKKVAVETAVANMDLSDNSEANSKNKSKFDEEFFKSNPLEKDIQELDFRAKIVFVLHDIENFYFDDIAEQVLIPAADVKKLLKNAREKLILLSES